MSKDVSELYSVAKYMQQLIKSGENTTKSFEKLYFKALDELADYVYAYGWQ